MTATVADVVTFESWPVEQQELAKRVLWYAQPPATRRDVDDIRADLQEAESMLSSARRALVQLEGKIK